MIAIDTETGGLDVWNGSAEPFFVTACMENGEQLYWEWDVDPLTRRSIIPKADLNEIHDLVFESGEELVFHNSKFDVSVLVKVDKRFLDWDWSKTHDTLIAGHVLESNAPHNLTDMGINYLRVNITKYEDALEQACKQARSLARRKYKTWKIAKEGLEGMPSAKQSGKKSNDGSADKTWKFDMWLPRAIAREEEYEESHPWWTVLAEYANTDSGVTLPLWQVLEQKLKARGLWKIYLERLKAQRMAYKMQKRGVTVSGIRLAERLEEYQTEATECENLCLNIAQDKGFNLVLAKGGAVNDSMREFIFEVLGLEGRRGKKSKTDKPTLDKEAMSYYLETLDRDSIQRLFIKKLLEKRARDKACGDMRSYMRFWQKIKGCEGWYSLHPHLNPTGTNTLRWSCKLPNEQNISDKEEFNIRYVFGPAPGREWWSCDAKNIELRIPFYEAQEEECIALFERPNDPPYFGSNHLLNAHVIWENEFNSCKDENGVLDGNIFKERFKKLYKQTKNGDFALQYQCSRDKADATFGKPGCYDLLKKRFARLDALNRKWVAFANKYGYVETLPDKSIDPTRGYPILCTRTERGGIKPTVPLSYHIQSTAMWWTHRGTVRCDEQLERWNREERFDGFITMQVHDELDFDFPKSLIHPRIDLEREKKGLPIKYKGCSNLWRIRELQKLMSQGGVDIGIPTPVGCKYHEVSWDSGETME